MLSMKNIEDEFKVLRKIEKKPQASQRELALELGFSLGKLNYCLKALQIKGLVKINNFKKNPKKMNYIYSLTPHGISAKAKLTISFMKKKMQYVIPVAFIAKYSNEDPVKAIWAEVWEEITVNTPQGVRLHLSETVDKVISVLGAGSYDLRRQGADALSCVLEVLVSLVGRVGFLVFLFRLHACG